MFFIAPGPRSHSEAGSEALDAESIRRISGASPAWQANLFAFILLLASAGLLSGCGITTMADRTPPISARPVAHRLSTSPDVPAITQEEHDLAVAAVDFDPALDSVGIVAGKPYALLVAVENKGNRPEGAFTVSTQLLNEDH